MAIDHQFYPTPPSLSARMWSKFSDKNFKRVLEPSAGNGDLMAACPKWDGAYYRENEFRKRFDCIEIDMRRHPALHALGVNVVGFDFLQFQNGAAYSHCIINPPFAQGAAHVLHAWEILFDAELVAIVNATTVRDPSSAERKHLVRLIEEHGSVEYLQDTFLDPDTQRKTSVEVALIHLCKKADVSSLLVDSLIDGLKTDTSNAETLSRDYHRGQELALPANVITNAVSCFNAAVRTMQQAVYSQAKANYYASALGQTMAVTKGDAGAGIPPGDTVHYVQKEIGAQFDSLKDRAWTHILQSSNVTSRLSSAAQKRVESEFNTLKKLEFCESNIYGFLQGIIDSAGDIQMEMICDLFDIITRYHSDNTVYFRGWVSNSIHRTAGMRIKATRFVLPGFGCDRYVSWDNQRRLSDFDKVMSMLDGKSEPQVSLSSTFHSPSHELLSGERVSTDYFDVRWFRGGAGTVHFFPRSKELMDTLNRWVGKRRQWLPPDTEKVVPDFWQQYEQAEKFDSAVRKELAKVRRTYWQDPLDMIARGRDETGSAMAELDAALKKIQAEKGIDVDRLLGHEAPQQQLLLAA